MTDQPQIPPHVAAFYAALGAYWPERFKPTGESLAAWAPHLAPFPPEALAACAKRLAFRDDWPPSFARCIEELSEGPLAELGAPPFEDAIEEVRERARAACTTADVHRPWMFDLARRLHYELGHRGTAIFRNGTPYDVRRFEEYARGRYEKLRTAAREELVQRAALGEVPDAVLLAGLERGPALLECKSLLRIAPPC